MRRTCILFLSALMWLTTAFAQSPDLLKTGEIFFDGVYHTNGDTTGTSDVWGWIHPDGTEYVIVGVHDGVSFVRASDMQEIDRVIGPSQRDYYFHRDIKTYRNYAYISAEMTGVNEGIMIIDMSFLPDSVHFVKSLTDRITTSHNLSIDTARARAYVTGSTFEGVYIYDLFDPENPISIAYMDESNVHDVVARNDTAWIANGIGGDYSMWDVADPGNPQLILRLTKPDFGYCHNIWPLKDGRQFATTEETADKTVKIWEYVSQDSATLLSEYLAPNKLAHNVHVEGDSLYISHYASGVTIVDVSDPRNPVEVRQFDTYLINDTSDFYGCWGVYPHSPTGNIYASNFEGTVQKLRFDYPTAISPDHTFTQSEVSPNPSEFMQLRADWREAIPVDIQLYTLDGQRVKRYTHLPQSAGEAFQVRENTLPQGVYFVSWKQGQLQGQTKWVKGTRK